MLNTFNVILAEGLTILSKETEKKKKNGPDPLLSWETHNKGAGAPTHRLWSLKEPKARATQASLDAQPFRAGLGAGAVPHEISLSTLAKESKVLNTSLEG